MKISKKLAQQIVLEDDDTETGGIAFVGETLADFIDDVYMAYNLDLAYYNAALVKCGIKRICAQQIEKVKQSKK